MKRIIKTILASTLMLSAVACSSNDTATLPVPTETVTETAAPEASSEEELFVEYLRTETDGWDVIPEGDIIFLAETMCSLWSDGATMNDMAGMFLDSGYTPEEAGTFIGAGTEALCPEYNSMFS